MKKAMGEVNMLGVGMLAAAGEAVGPADRGGTGRPPPPPPRKLSSSAAFIIGGGKLAVMPKLSATLKFAEPPNRGLLGGFLAIFVTKGDDELIDNLQ